MHLCMMPVSREQSVALQIEGRFLHYYMPPSLLLLLSSVACGIGNTTELAHTGKATSAL